MSVLVRHEEADEEFFSRDGYLISTNSRSWRLNRDVEIPTFSLKSYLDGELHTSALKVLAFFAKSSSPSHVQNMFYRFKHYLESPSGLPPLSVDSLISYRSTLGKKDEWYMATIRVFVKQWRALGYPGVPDDTMALLANWVLKGNEKGAAVQSMCPEKGPFTDIEMDMIVESIISEYGAGGLDLADACYIMVLCMTGRRPSQITALRRKDLIKANGKFFINFPRGKQQNTTWRGEFSAFPIVEDLWHMLELQSESVSSLFLGKFNKEDSPLLALELPLFPVRAGFDNEVLLEEYISGDMLHAPSADVAKALIRVGREIRLISERTGQQIHLNPNRFRYTLGTNLGREGKGELIIAEALDHSDTQSAGVYVRNIPEIVERIDKAVAMQLAPIAQAFRGVLVASERDARRGDDPSSRISNGAHNIGTCGSYGFCGALAPIACYTCSHFQPWLDGPHEGVLDGLIRERDRVLEATGDKKIASINDRLILAVGDVVSRCNAMRGGSNG